jgi:hypothetical protein
VATLHSPSGSKQDPHRCHASTAAKGRVSSPCQLLDLAGNHEVAMTEIKSTLKSSDQEEERNRHVVFIKERTGSVSVN